MKIPGHITIIMDGNGRWAGKQGKQRLFGHNAGADSVRVVCERCVELGVRYLSLFAFSEENWSRPAEEIDGLMKLMARSVLGERDTFRRHNIRFLVIGNRSRLNPELMNDIEAAERETASNTGLTLIVMLSYSGKWDILSAARSYAEKCVRAREVLPLDEESFAGMLATAAIPEPDLMIRTSGEQRISNYMLWQCAYTEFYFTPVLWPDFRKADLDLAINEYNNRERRYGRIE